MGKPSAGKGYHVSVGEATTARQAKSRPASFLCDTTTTTMDDKEAALGLQLSLWFLLKLVRGDRQARLQAAKPTKTVKNFTKRSTCATLRPRSYELNDVVSCDVAR